MLSTIIEWMGAAVFLSAAVTDLRNRTIPNLIPMAAIALFVAWGITNEAQLTLWMSHAAVGAVVLIGGVALHAGGAWGGGDAKLLSAAALWAGAPGIAILMGTLAAGAFALAAASALPYRWSRRMRRSVPLGCAIAAAAVAAIANMESH